MKTKILLPVVFFSVTFLLPCFSRAQILMNGGFETWYTGTGGVFLEPNGWTSNNTSTSAYVVQAPGRTGMYSANMIPIPTSPIGGSIYQEHYGPIGFQSSVSLTGYWKGDFTGANNRIKIDVFAKDGTLTTYLQCYFDSPSDTILTDWTPFNFPLGTLQQNHLFLGCRFMLVSSSANTSGFIDDVDLVITTSVHETQAKPSFGVSISQITDDSYSFTFNLPSPQALSLRIFSMDGKIISEKKYSLQSGHQQIAVSTENLEAGIYLCNVSGESINKVLRIMRP